MHVHCNITSIIGPLQDITTFVMKGCLQTKILEKLLDLNFLTHKQYKIQKQSLVGVLQKQPFDKKSSSEWQPFWKLKELVFSLFLAVGRHIYSSMNSLQITLAPLAQLQSIYFLTFQGLILLLFFSKRCNRESLNLTVMGYKPTGFLWSFSAFWPAS